MTVDGRDRAIGQLVESMRLGKPVFVTKPTLPALDRFSESLEEVWDAAWLTNTGPQHERLEARLSDYLGVDHLSLVSSGTMALVLALRCLRPTRGEVITTPFTFAATIHAIEWAGYTPVFADIDADSLGLDPSAVEAAITDRTVAILPVHVFGVPCLVDSIEELGSKNGLEVIYDAAHSFGVRLGSRSLCARGDRAALSFHATKLFSTVEGGAVVSRDAETKRRIDYLRNFGIEDEQLVSSIGVNGKLSELHAAFGLLQLDRVAEEITRRKRLAAIYQEQLADLPGVEVFRGPEAEDLESNGAFLPIRVDASQFGADRDELFRVLRQCQVFARAYFSPLICSQPPYAHLPSATLTHLPVARKAAEEILCLPLYGTLEVSVALQICKIVRAVHRL